MLLFSSWPSVIVTDNMLIALRLADDIIERTASLALISENYQPELHVLAKNSLNA